MIALFVILSIVTCLACAGVVILTIALMGARMSIEEAQWDMTDLRREQRLKLRWRERADGANKQKKFWRRRARFNRALVDKLERERLELSQQLHFATLAYERMVDAVFRGRPAGLILDTDLKNKKAPAAFATGAS